MNDAFPVICPYCGEGQEVRIEPDVSGEFVQDCEVCCHPWLVRVEGKGNARRVTLARADGSE